MTISGDKLNKYFEAVETAVLILEDERYKETNQEDLVVLRELSAEIREALGAYNRSKLATAIVSFDDEYLVKPPRDEA